MSSSHATRSLALAGALILSVTGPAAAQSVISPDDALKRAAANEERLRGAEREFSYRQEILVQWFGTANTVRAQLHRVSEWIYDSLGNRTERIISYPPSQLTVVLGVLQPDFKSLLGVDPFFLTSDALPNYSIKFVGREKLDELNTYVFEVEPLPGKPLPKREKAANIFKGRLWIDDQDFQIVRFEGKAVTSKDDPARYPKFECYRENVESNLWLPSMAYARDLLEFPRVDVPIKIEIKYSGYKRVKPGK